MKPILWTNYTDRDFHGRFGGQDHVILAGQSLWLPGELACHFAKHLSDRELGLQGKQVNDQAKHEVIKKISPELVWNDGKHFVKVVGEIGSLSKVDQQIAMLNKVDALPAFAPEAPVEVTPTVTVELPVNTPSDEESTEEKPLPLVLQKRGELEAKALALGYSEVEVDEAPNKGALIAFIEAGKKVPPMEVEFEGVSNP